LLTRTAVLERMCGPLCEAVLELSGWAAALTELAPSNMLLVPLDHQGQWYRYHHLVRDMLLAELEPGLIPVLQRRAVGWDARTPAARCAGHIHGRAYRPGGGGRAVGRRGRSLAGPGAGPTR